MNALVADVAVAGIPEPVPVVFEAQLVERAQGRGSKEEIPVHTGRRRAVGLVADGGAPLEAQPLGQVDLADHAFLYGLQSPHLEGRAAVLRADLQHALGLARHLNHPLAFVNVVAGGLFAIDVLARLHRPDRRQRVPVIGRGNRNSLDARIGEGLAHVFKFLGLFPCDPLQGRLRFFTRSLVDIAKADNLRFGQPGVDIQMIGSPAAEAYDRDVDFVIGAPDACGRGCRGRSEKKPAGSGGMRHVDAKLLYRGLLYQGMKGASALRAGIRPLEKFRLLLNRPEADFLVRFDEQRQPAMEGHAGLARARHGRVAA